MSNSGFGIGENRHWMAKLATYVSIVTPLALPQQLAETLLALEHSSAVFQVHQTARQTRVCLGFWGAGTAGKKHFLE